MDGKFSLGFWQRVACGALAAMILPLAAWAAPAKKTPSPASSSKSSSPSFSSRKNSFTNIHQTIKRLVKADAAIPSSVSMSSSVDSAANKHPLVLEEERLRQRLKAVPDSDLTSVYLNFISHVADYLQAQDPKVDVEIGLNSSKEGLRLRILPTDSSELNRYAQEMDKEGYIVRYMGLDAILKPSYTTRLLYPFIDQKEINLGSRALSDVDYFKKSAMTQATTLMVQRMNRGELNFLNNPSLARMGDEELFKGRDTFDPHNDLVLDTKYKTVIAANSYARTHLLDFYTHALALYLSSGGILKRYQQKQDVAQGEVASLRRSYHFLLLKVATRLQDLNAMIFTMIKHPEQVKIEPLLNNKNHAAIKVHPIPEHKDFFIALKFPWRHPEPPTVAQLLADGEFQGIYRYNYALFAQIYSAERQMADYTLSPFIALQNIWPMMEEMPDLPKVTQNKVQSLWTLEKWLHKIKYIGPIIQDLIRQDYAESAKIPAASAESLTTGARHPLRALENEYRRKIKQEIFERRPGVFLEYLGKIKAYLTQQDIEAEIYDFQRENGQDYWLQILPSTRSPLNIFAQSLAAQGIHLQLAGMRDLFKDTMVGELSSANFVSRRSYLGVKALENPAALLQDAELQRSLATFKKLQQNELTFLNNPLIIFQGKRFLPPPNNMQFPYSHLVLDPQIFLTVMLSPHSVASFNYIELYQKSLNLYHMAQAILQDLTKEKGNSAEWFGESSLIQDLQSKYGRLLLTSANALNGFNTILYFMLNPATAHQISFKYYMPANQLDIMATPDLRYPNFIYKVVLPWPASISPDISVVLNDENFQALYRYNVAMFTQLQQNFAQICQLRTMNVAEVKDLLGRLDFLQDSPPQVIQETKAKLWPRKDLADAITQSQP
ncbi:MAG: hypothetical protein J6Y94_06490, partial [Bacteriovoracaceae bacterium]|nr:hypothetical protein [Bacteriovoracaceae bacterium]